MISIIIPVYNAEKTLEKTLREIPSGVVNKIILVDDKSSDRTVKVAKKLKLTTIR